jgi:hypothetical protein
MRGFVIREIGKRHEMRQVSSFVAIFVPIRRLACTISPLANAALYLIIAENISQEPRKRWYSGFDAYHRECEGDSLDWNRHEKLIEDNPISVLALEPHQIDSLLNDRVSICVLTRPTDLEFLLRERSLICCQRRWRWDEHDK